MAILDDSGQQLSYPYLYNLPENSATRPELPGEGIAWDVIYSRQPGWSSITPAHPLAKPALGGGRHPFVLRRAGDRRQQVPGRVEGIFTYNADRVFEPRDLALVEIVGRQTGVAIQNARLFESAQRRAVEAETLRQAASAVNSALEIEPVLDKILEQLENVLPNDSSSVFLIEGDHVRMKAGRGLPNLRELLDVHFSLQNPLFVDIDNNRPRHQSRRTAEPRFERWATPITSTAGSACNARASGERIGYLTIDSCKINAYSHTDADTGPGFLRRGGDRPRNARSVRAGAHAGHHRSPDRAVQPALFLRTRRGAKFERSRRYKAPLAVILIDLDHFKGVNDTSLRHMPGTTVLDHPVASAASRACATWTSRPAMGRGIHLPAGPKPICQAPTCWPSACASASKNRCRQPQPADCRLGQPGRSRAGRNLPRPEHPLVQHADQAMYATKRTNRGSHHQLDPGPGRRTTAASVKVASRTPFYAEKRPPHN